MIGGYKKTKKELTKKLDDIDELMSNIKTDT